MRRKTPITRSRNTLLAVLLVLSLAGLLLPRSWTGRLISLVQVLVPFQDATLAVAENLSSSDESDTPVSAATFAALERSNAALRHQVAALSVRMAELDDENRILAATRLWGDQQDRIGSQGSLIPAKVLTQDMLPWRSSRLINAGTLQGIRQGNAVASRFFEVNRGEDAGVRTGMAILLGESLVGIVERTGTHTSQVKLLSDVTVEMKVRIGRFTEAGFEPLRPFFWLVGCGRGTMEIHNVDRRDVDNGLIQKGDIVLSNPNNRMLPASLVIGSIAAIKPDRENPLLRILAVDAAVDPQSLRRVYVFDPGTESGSK